MSRWSLVTSCSFTALALAGCGGGEGTIGPEGPPGPTGAMGAQGAAGPAGATGPAGPRGVDGAQGPAGAMGMVGATGPAGAQGVVGPAGPAGPQGMVGAQGMVGPAGANGAAGAQGPAGAVGPAGPAGTFSGTFNGDVTFTGNLTLSGSLTRAIGSDRANAGSSCNAVHVARPTAPSGVYWLLPATARSPFEAYCDMVTDGGGWTLVWSNLRGGRAKPTTELQWKAAITTPPRTDGRPVSADLEGFVVYTGLLHWTALAPAGLLRTDWAPDYNTNIEQRYRCPFTLGNNYAINFPVAQCMQQLGNVVPGIVADHNGSPFSAYDRDLDSLAGSCAVTYGNSPWWYTNCWSGSMAGDGEYTQSGHQNGAYWRGSAGGWGSAGGVGAGNGWIYVR